MDEHYSEQQIDPGILKLTRFKSRRLAGKYGFARHDAEDIEQELLLDFLQRSKSFDAHRCSRRTFARLVINHRVATIIDAGRAACRDYRAGVISLNQVPDGISEAVGVDGTESLNLKLDVQRALCRLPAALAHLCRVLMVSETCAEAAAATGMSRPTLYRKIRAVRGLITEAGLGR